MKKENKNKTTELFEAFLPDRAKEDPNENLKKEKKLFSIIFIVVCTLLLVGNLIAMIINFCFSIQDGLNSLFVGFINCAIGIFILGLLIVLCHNISKMTRATLFICSKLMKDEKRLLNAEKNKSVKEEIVENTKETSPEQEAVVKDEPIEEVPAEKVDIIVDEN